MGKKTELTDFQEFHQQIEKGRGFISEGKEENDVAVVGSGKGQQNERS